MRTFFIALTTIALLAGGTLLYTKFVSPEPVGNFKTSVVKRGELLVTINSTGTVEPQELIDVGAQVQGKIYKFGKDLRGTNDPKFTEEEVDYNSPVDEGTVLAWIDDSVYRANRDQAQAALDRAKADLVQLEAKRDQAEAEWLRRKSCTT